MLYNNKESLVVKFKSAQGGSTLKAFVCHKDYGMAIFSVKGKNCEFRYGRYSSVRSYNIDM